MKTIFNELKKIIYKPTNEIDVCDLDRFFRICGLVDTLGVVNIHKVSENNLENFLEAMTIINNEKEMIKLLKDEDNGNAD